MRGSGKKKRGRRIIRLVLLLLVLGAVGYFVIFRGVNRAVTVTYDTFTTRKGNISNTLSFSGSMSAKNYETLSADNAGTVRKIYVSEAENVEKNERLIRLSTGEIIKASFSGQVNEIAVSEGDEVTANQNLIQIVDFTEMTVSIRVDEYSISKVYLGQPCKVNLTALGTSFDTKIAHINRISSSNGNTAYYSVSCDVTVTEDVLPGMQVTVTIPLEEATDAVILSKSALSFAGDNSAYVLVKGENDEMSQVPVTVGVDNNNYVEIVSGLTEGQTVYKVAEQKAAGNTGLFSGFQNLSTGSGQNNSSQNRQYRQNQGNYQRNTGGNMGGMPPGGMR